MLILTNFLFSSYFFFCCIFISIDGDKLEKEEKTIPTEAIREALIIVKNTHMNIIPEKLEKKINVVKNAHLSPEMLEKIKGKSNLAQRIQKLKEITLNEYHFSLNQNEYLFIEYAPQIFTNLRENFGIESAKYFNSLTEEPCKGFVNPGKSKSTFLKSWDEKFFLKSLVPFPPDFEHRILLENLSEYADYMIENKNSFLTKYCGIYSIQKKNSDKIFWFFTMQNLLKPQNDLLNMPENRIDYRLDLKGYQAKNRRLSEKKLQRDEITYKEWEFNGPENEKALFPDGITLEEGIYELIAKNLANDSMFLAEQFKVCDYSLFVGIHFNDANEENEATKKMKDENNSGKIIRLSNGGIGGIYCIGCKPPAAAVDINHSIIKANNENQSNEKKKYSISIFIGIIDLLHEFNNVYRRFRMVNNIYVKRIFVEGERSTIQPIKYAARFKCFINKQIFHVENEEKKQIHSAEYCEDFNDIDWSRDKKWTRSDEERTFGGYIDRSGKHPKIVFPNQIKYKKP